MYDDGSGLGALILIAVVGVFIWSCKPPNIKREREKAMKKHQDEEYALFLTPRWIPEELEFIYPGATIVLNAAQRFGHEWHVVLTPYNAAFFRSDDAILRFFHDNDWFLACTGKQIEPIGITPMLAAFDSLSHTITCPTCLDTMTRIYSASHQPHLASDLYQQQAQLLLSPEFVDWDVTKLRPQQPQKQKAKPQKQNTREQNWRADV